MFKCIGSFGEEAPYSLRDGNRNSEHRRGDMDQKLYFERGRFRSSLWFWPCVLAALIVSAVWLWGRAYQSHYISALRMLGDTTTQAYWGHPREGRGDEWATYLPMLKEDYLQGFRKVSNLPPYYERLEWFISLPHKDFSLLFLPNQIAYWILPGGMALSFQGLYYNFIFLFSLTWLLRNLGVRTGLAITSSGLLLFSQFYQLWWTSNFPALGAAFLPFAIFTSHIDLRARVLLMCWSVAHVILGQMYPPFYVAMAFAIAPFIFVMRPDLISLRNIFISGMASLVALVAYIYLKWDFFDAVSHTTYPGHRVSIGGGGSLSMILTALFPSYPAVSSGNYGDPLYELSAASTIMSVLVIACVPTMKWDSVQIKLTWVTTIIFVLMSTFMIFGFPRYLAIATEFSLVPTNRMQLGLSILVFFYSTITVSRQLERLNFLNVGVVLFLYLIILYVIKQPGYVLKELPWVKFQQVAVLAGVVASIIMSTTFRGSSGKLYFLTGLAGLFVVTNAAAFGSFNPVMNASDIMRPVDSKFIRDWKLLYALNDKQPIAIGSYGDVLRGENLPAMEAIQMANVDPLTYKQVFPELTWAQNRDVFNKFVGIAFSNIGKPDLSGVTVFFPLEEHAPNFLDKVYNNTEMSNILAGPVKYNILQADISGYDIWWSGVISSDVAARKKISLDVPCPVSDAWLTRLPSAYVGANGPHLPIVEGHLRVSATSQFEASQCAGRITAF